MTADATLFGAQKNFSVLRTCTNDENEEGRGAGQEMKNNNKNNEDKFKHLRHPISMASITFLTFKHFK